MAVPAISNPFQFPVRPAMPFETPRLDRKIRRMQLRQPWAHSQIGGIAHSGLSPLQPMAEGGGPGTRPREQSGLVGGSRRRRDERGRSVKEAERLGLVINLTDDDDGHSEGRGERKATVESASMEWSPEGVRRKKQRVSDVPSSSSSRRERQAFPFVVPTDWGFQVPAPHEQLQLRRMNSRSRARVPTVDSIGGFFTSLKTAKDEKRGGGKAEVFGGVVEDPARAAARAAAEAEARKIDIDVPEAFVCPITCEVGGSTGGIGS